MIFFSHFKAAVTSSGGKPPGSKQLGPSSFTVRCCHAQQSFCSPLIRGGGKVPPLLQAVPPATADLQDDRSKTWARSAVEREGL